MSSHDRSLYLRYAEALSHPNDFSGAIAAFFAADAKDDAAVGVADDHVQLTVPVDVAKRGRAVIGLSLSVLFVIIYENAAPYATTPLNALSFAAAWQLVAIYAGGVMVVARPCDYPDWFLGGALLLACRATGHLRPARPLRESQQPELRARGWRPPV